MPAPEIGLDLKPKEAQKPCKICRTKTDVGFNINFTIVPICESCAEAIFIQQAKWYVKNK